MRKKLLLTLFLFTVCIFMAHSQNKLNITVDGKTISATLKENNATKALVEKLQGGPVTITMSNYGGFEKVGALPWPLPTSDTRITTRPGDIMLYTGNNIVIFYGENTWAYTPLGILETTDSKEIREFVGDGDKKVTLALAALDHVEEISIDRNTEERVFALDGKEIFNRPLPSGLYIINNKKVSIK